jgi:hypothetical protein
VSVSGRCLAGATACSADRGGSSYPLALPLFDDLRDAPSIREKRPSTACASAFGSTRVGPREAASGPSSQSAASPCTIDQESSTRASWSARETSPSSTQAATPGTYAVIVFHDENQDGKLDKNFLGVPQEGYGASNNVRHLMSAPEFEEASFVVPAAAVTPIKVQVRY